ncbi:MAG: DUF3473 domain-containing protein [Acidobacteria bacterium]|jgi:hypothetical protein|nr:DUF3473 domain-containing protein [Acidobacteriota bacterium]
MVPAEFRDDLSRTRAALEALGTNPIVGFRAGRWLRAEDLWILDILAEEGFVYDSSINPVLRRLAGDQRRYELHRHRHSAGDLALWEFPISTASVLGYRIAISGGNYIRQLPHAFLSRATARWAAQRRSPLVFYFMPWELDREQPHIASLPLLQRVRRYRNPAKTRWVVEEYLRLYRFVSIGDFLDLPRDADASPQPDRAEALEIAGSEKDTTGPDRIDVTLVVPLFDEEQYIVYLKRTLRNLRIKLAPKYRIHTVLVDDGSGDRTWDMLRDSFDGEPRCTLLRHEANRGIAAAIATGLRAAPTEFVCSIDCDCSCDPATLEDLIPLLDRADLVAASPYHPKGTVLNVPRWRLFLSKKLSRLYSLAIGERLYTFTSCCRADRKSAVAAIPLAEGGFLGIAELLLRHKLAGGRVVEQPAVLESRLLGASRMNTLGTIWEHLGMLRRPALGGLGPRRAAQPGGPLRKRPSPAPTAQVYNSALGTGRGRRRTARGPRGLASLPRR